MSAEEFWYGEPRLTEVYRKAHTLRQEMKNQDMWIQGIYVHRAVSSVAESLAYGFSGGKGNKPSRYPEMPFPFTKEEQERQTEINKQRTLAWVESGQH